MRMIDVGDAQLASSELGGGEGAAVVMLHGLITGNMASWYFPIAAPLSRSRRVILYDLRGHGSSSLAEGGYDIPTQTQDLEAVLTAHDCKEPIDLVGHSIGAAIALHFAISRPSRVRRLALVDPPFPLEAHMVVHAQAFERASTSQGIGEWAATAVGRTAWTRSQKRLRERMGQLLHRTSLPEDLRAATSPVEQALSALEIPVLIVAGSRSEYLTGCRRLSTLIPIAELLRIDCGHEIPALAPGPLLNAFVRFFAIETGGKFRETL